MEFGGLGALTETEDKGGLARAEKVEETGTLTAPGGGNLALSN